MMRLNIIIDRVILYNSYFKVKSFKMRESYCYFTYYRFKDVSSLPYYTSFIAIVEYFTSFIFIGCFKMKALGKKHYCLYSFLILIVYIL